MYTSCVLDMQKIENTNVYLKQLQISLLQF